MKTYPNSVNNVVIFPVMETDYSTNLIILCSETSLQQKLLHTSVKNVVLFFSYGDRAHFSEQCGTFSVMETDYSIPSITVALWHLLTLYLVYISFPSIKLQKRMNETGENMVSYSTCH